MCDRFIGRPTRCTVVVRSVSFSFKEGRDVFEPTYLIPCTGRDLVNDPILHPWETVSSLNTRIDTTTSSIRMNLMSRRGTTPVHPSLNLPYGHLW